LIKNKALLTFRASYMQDTTFFASQLTLSL